MTAKGRVCAKRLRQGVVGRGHGGALTLSLSKGVSGG